MQNIIIQKSEFSKEHDCSRFSQIRSHIYTRVLYIYTCIIYIHIYTFNIPCFNCGICVTLLSPVDVDNIDDKLDEGCSVLLLCDPVKC